MKERQGQHPAANPGKEWQKTQFANLIRYVPSGTYYARLKVKGKLVRKSLKTDVISVAKMRLSDFEKHEREAAETGNAVSAGRMAFRDALAVYSEETEASHLLKPLAKRYRGEITKAIVKSWPGLESLDVRRIGESDCREWASRFGNSYSATRYNAALGALKSAFNIAIQK